MNSILAFIGPGGPELIVIMLVLLLMFGSKDAPRIFRKINEFINQLRNTADGFKREVMYSDIESTTSAAEDYGTDNPYEGEDDYHDDDYNYMDEEDADYSDETFMNLEHDLDQTPDVNAEVAEPIAETPETGDDDARKA